MKEIPVFNIGNTENQEASECNCDIQGMYRKLHTKASARELRIQSTLDCRGSAWQIHFSNCSHLYFCM